MNPTPNRLTPLQFVLGFGAVSMLADMVYEGARSITGPYLANFGASAALVGFITGLGEAVALVFRLATGRLSDRTHRYWALSISGYLITIIAVPLIGCAQAFWQAAGLIITERFGKAVRTPARDTMLAQASVDLGRGTAFAIHEVLDKTGSLAGPMVVAAMIAGSGYRAAFAVLAVPGALALLVLAWLRGAAPRPAAYEPMHPQQPLQRHPGLAALPRRFWLYAGFTGVSMLGSVTFAVLAFHQEVTHVVAPTMIPITYSAAMGASALAAVGSGRLYDRTGLRGLIIALPLACAIPMLSFSTRPALVWTGAVLWGAVTGIHESTMRAAVADLVPAAVRGTAYGIFTAIYGFARLAGATLVGALYGHSVALITALVVATQLAALVPFAVLMRTTAQPAGSR